MTSYTYTNSLEPVLISQERVLLSICIATYNRADFIGATIESIVSQICDDIEIIIVDGASPDNTHQVVLNYQRLFPQIKYYRLPEKGGVDRDYCKAIEFANGMYCWLFTDDDTLDTNAINTVLTAIKTEEYALIVLNARLCSRDLVHCYRNKFLNFDSNREYTCIEEQEQFFRDVANYLSFIGGVIIRRDLWNERNKELYFGTEFVHVGVIFQKKIDEKILVISNPFISIRMNNSQWNSRAFKIWIITWPQLIWSFSSFSESSRRNVCPRYPSQNLWNLLYYRAMASYSVSDYKNYIKPYSNTFFSKILALIIALLPGVLVNLFFILYASIRRRYWMIEELIKSRNYFINFMSRSVFR